MRKDFSAAAKAFVEFIKIYGPKQDEKGEVVSPPWKPAAVDDQARQVFEAALRVAHAWYLQGHQQNMVKSYEWLARNFGFNNPSVAEAHYWLAMELGKGKEAEKKENKRKLAEALWKNVVNSSLDFNSPKFKQTYHPWTRGAPPEVETYVRSAMMKAGQAYGEADEHELAANIFQKYLELFAPTPERRKKIGNEVDDMYPVARYALGREYLALDNIPKLTEAYKPYLNGLRNESFRFSALQLLGFHAGRAGRMETASEAYGTLLDEYGENALDPKGKPIPVPAKERLRQGDYKWDGIRLKPPDKWDRGDLYFSLGYLYWKQENWIGCAKTLAPFLDQADLAKSPSRPRALFMLGQSLFKQQDLVKALQALAELIKGYPQFDGLEEAYVYAARSACETKNWTEFARLYKEFQVSKPRSDRRPYLDFYAALAQIGQDKIEPGLAALKDLGGSDTFEDVKADACYHYGKVRLEKDPTKADEALSYFEKSMKYFPREAACFEAGKCALGLKKLEKARDCLERAVRDFPKGDKKVIADAQTCLGEVQKQLAAQKKP